MTPLRRPDFLIIGAQKCGTSWLHHQLRQSDGIDMPADKDFEQFTYLANVNQTAFQAYCERFRDAPPDQLVGDANAAYFWTRTNSPWGLQPEGFNPDIPRSIHQFCGPDLKLILMLRDPVERAISAYLHHLRHGALTLDRSILDRDLPLGIVDMGLYRIHLENWLSVYPEAQLHLISALPANEEAAIRNVEAACNFLGAPAPPRERYHLQPVFPGLDRVVDEEGVWLNVSDNPGWQAAGGSRPLAWVDGQPHVQAVSPEELAELHRILDAHRVDRLSGSR